MIPGINKKAYTKKTKDHNSKNKCSRDLHIYHSLPDLGRGHPCRTALFNKMLSAAFTTACCPWLGHFLTAICPDVGGLLREVLERIAS